MQKRLTNNFWLKLLSLGLAIMIWMIIYLSANLQYWEKLKTTIPVSSTTSNNQTSQSVEDK